MAGSGLDALIISNFDCSQKGVNNDHSERSSFILPIHIDGTACNRLQHPPVATCRQCGSGDNLEWKGMSGRAKIYNYTVVYDTPIKMLQEDQPFNLAVVMLDEDPGIQMYSHLPGTPVDEVPVGASVEVIFEATANGQKVPEWRVAG